jgi:hypothetical protein
LVKILPRGSEVLAAVLPGRGELPADLKQAIDSLVVLDDAALWQAAESGLADDIASELEAPDILTNP